MRKIKEVLRLKFELGLDNRQVAQCCSISHVSVGNYLTRFQESGLSWPLPAEIDDRRLNELLFRSSRSPRHPHHPLPDMLVLHRELCRKGVTLQLLWEEYKEVHPDGYQYRQFCEHYRRWAKTLDVCLRQEYRAGEKMFVDYAGQTVPLQAAAGWPTQEAHLFVAVLGASNYTYVEATLMEQLPDWIEAHRPKAHQRYLEWTPSRLIRWAGTVGENCAQVVQKILESKVHPEQGYRSCLGLLRLSRGYEQSRMDAACQRALLLDVCSYKSIKSILERKMDQQSLGEAEPVAVVGLHENVRGQTYYE